MLKPFLIFLTILSASFTLCAKNTTAYKVSYQYFINESEIAERTTNILFYNNITYLEDKIENAQNLIDFSNHQVLSCIQNKQEWYKNTLLFTALPQAQYVDSTKTILGQNCKYAIFSSFSNTIKVWYTEELPAKGSPYKTYIPSDNALVLEVTINDTYSYKAQSIEKIKPNQLPNNYSITAMETSAAQLEEYKILNRYVSIPVFENDSVHFDPNTTIYTGDTLQFDTTYHYSNGSIVLKRIKVPEIWKKGAMVFAELKCRSNGDAYDRIGSVFILPSSSKPTTMLDAFKHGIDTLPIFKDRNGGNYQGIISTEKYNVPIELMRFATSFGVGYFNDKRIIHNYNWKDEATYKADITDILPLDTEELTIGIFIGNYDMGGHKVSLDLNFYPNEFDSDPPKKISLPLFYTTNIMEMSGQNYGRFFNTDTLSVKFKLNTDLENAQLIYTSTGHGGWGGGDEFNPKRNQIFIDGKEIYSVIPWRTDCATYRLYNPASGNFSNGMSSSDYSRSNWCPAALTPPYNIQLGSLKKGEHLIKVAIDQGEQEGGSFSHWCVSGLLTGTQK